ncbi:hypothetical protein RUM44_010657 [Polyplax serrata]|uniref:Uncharacterized protein n=1 Tax=Polyplax serrata TaxID=468196 RepID=A0ABR1AMT5_POLSC
MFKCLTLSVACPADNFQKELALFSLLGGILYLAASVVVIKDWRDNLNTRTARLPSKQYQDMTISAGALGLLTGLIMFFETGCYIFYDSDDDDD